MSGHHRLGNKNVPSFLNECTRIDDVMRQILSEGRKSLAQNAGT